ncbi:malolactic enzyme [Lentilactobacillus laojiaonis]|uniref:malolactic enzyme n=1 Tax=Lentilactobacillus laojiaonis TaxID=2883998 RepID=UPI001D0A429F|nr:malolactic enzyme [Lentilactobacillus laojiaonis]UDM32010.1 NAD-dependent malic enzyme [Lentilactobacillus laojiaonis]
MQAEEILLNPFLNKGTAFTATERDKFKLNGLVPPAIEDINTQAIRSYAEYQHKSSALEKRLYLMQIFNENRTLFYYLFSKHVAEFMPIVYDPTIADTIEHYSNLYVQSQGAVFLSIDDQEHMEEAIINGANGRDIQLIVVTDAEGILGIGDWGTNGVDIAVGKLMVYTAAAGIDPAKVLPVVLDAGTNNEKLLNDDLYLGNRHKRIYGPTYDQFVDRFVEIVENQFPNLYLHFEDFGRRNADQILNRYKDKILTFNDDIQGTGIITLAGILGALNISKEKLTDQIYLSFGAGTAGAGIVNRIYQEMLQQGLTPKEAKSRFYLVDKQGLLFDDDPTLTPAQKPFARKRSEFTNDQQLTDLLSVVKAVHPTIMVGTSTVAGAFTQEVVTEMANHTKRPIIFPISNPTKLTEATAKDLIQWTDGRALIATGIPSKPVEYKGTTYQIGQANNALIYPGLGLGAIAVNAKLLTDGMISAAAHSLGGIVDASEPGAAVLPPVNRLTEFSQTIAQAVAQAAVDEDMNQQPVKEVTQAIKNHQWTAKYQNLSK